MVFRFGRSSGEPKRATIADLRARRDQPGTIADLAPRTIVDVIAEVEHVCTIDIDGSPAFEIAVGDGSGTLVALWTGRRSIACIEPGRRLALYARAAPLRREDSLVVYNPRYELLL